MELSHREFAEELQKAVREAYQSGWRDAVSAVRNAITVVDGVPEQVNKTQTELVRE